MTGVWWSDDDSLLADLRVALSSAAAVPPEFVEAGKAAFTWHTIDAELAALTFDSAMREVTAATRAEAAPLRALTFASADATVELEISADAVFGQVVPACAGCVMAHTAGGPIAAFAIDEAGFFAIRPVPRGPFRLRCTTRSVDIVTGWVDL